MTPALLKTVGPLALVLLLAGCGQKGPLYLPDDEAAAERYGSRPTSQQEPATDATEEDTN
ncbi:MAG TPA: lipoprotein [Candidatus Halomonas stercoripullorum]|mgnify:FL=1|uniref:Lipoprotein n=1 Tax=Candidatus Halomonas stercoripullorum TaxID=2838617 RepID=A0A9D1WM31_9GAMM|nr:lipoprotein [Candidatus Halomonas stercoripullorum]